MTEIEKSVADAGHLSKGCEEDMRQAIELLFFAYRDFTGEADAILSTFSFGRAHHRVVYFIGRNPEITVTRLLAILKITKQSLARVLGQLIDEGFVEQKTDAGDRRRRLLGLTQKGIELDRRLTERQSRRIAGAYQVAGQHAIEGFRQILRGIINEEDRVHVDNYFTRPGTDTDVNGPR
ncbi:MAG: MarR family transcriptional regulator [Rhodospirillales bacterium]|nr:MarR family transcriptional regulator [Rhodospirillales bacterium]